MEAGGYCFGPLWAQRLGLYYYMKPVTVMLDSTESESSVTCPWLAKLLLFSLALISLFGGFFFGGFSS